MNESQKPAKDVLLPGAIIVAALLVAGALVYNTGSGAVSTGEPAEAPVPTGNLADDDVVLGSPSAPVTIVEFGDYQCPFCARFYKEVEPKLRDEYIKTGKAKMVYRDFAFLGAESQGAALASQCAAEQGKFWAYHDKLFDAETADGQENNGNLSADFFKSAASALGLDRAKFDSCMSAQKYKSEVEKDYNDGVAAGVRGTPATFIGGKMISGAAPYATFQAEIEAALKAVR